MISLDQPAWREELILNSGDNVWDQSNNLKQDDSFNTAPCFTSLKKEYLEYTPVKNLLKEKSIDRLTSNKKMVWTDHGMINLQFY